MLSKLNHILDTNLTQPLGRRAQGVLLALLLIIVIGQARTFAQTQDCVGSYETAVNGYYNDLMTKLREIENNYSWYNPMRTVMINAAGIEYYSRSESAWFQMISCSAFPLKG